MKDNSFPRDPIAALWAGMGRAHSSIKGWPNDGSLKSPCSFPSSECMTLTLLLVMQHISGHPEPGFSYSRDAGALQY